MIINCPSCATRYSLPEAEHRHMAITCRVCGHHWQQPEVIEDIDVTDTAADEPAPSLPPTIEHDDDVPELEARRLAQLAAEVKAQHASLQARRKHRQRQWTVFAALIVLPFAAAAFLPELVVKAAPVSVRVYEALGYDINLRGLDIRNVEQQHAIVDGLRVLAVKGEVRNISTTTRKVPVMHFSLIDPDGAEVYAWNLDTGARSLLAGETTGFVTRVEMPPETAQNLKIRFAQADEIGSPKGSLPTKP
jgi:hypothetical protein